MTTGDSDPSGPEPEGGTSKAPLEPTVVPDTLQTRDHYLHWDCSADAPRRPHWNGDFGISWSDPDEWHSFKDAVAEAAKRDSWGIGYVTAVNNDDYPTGVVSVIDVDGGGDPEDQLKDWVPPLDPFLENSCYVEWSPSHAEPGDSGLHIPVVGTDVPGWFSDTHLTDDEHEGIDLLTNKFCTVTGDRLDGAGDDLAEWSDDWVRDWLAQAYENLTDEVPRQTETLRNTTADSRKRGVTVGVGVDGRKTTTQDAESSDYDEWLDEDDVRDALRHITPDVGYPTWRNIGFALVDFFDDRAASRELFRAWSKGEIGEWDPSKWDSGAEDRVDEIVDNAKADAGANDVTIATVVDLAQKHGWQPANADAGDDDLVSKFIEACHRYQIDSGRVATEPGNDETVAVGVSAIVPESSIDDAVLAFNRNADLLDGTDRQAVIGYVILLDLQEHGEFFKTSAGKLYYFHEPETRVYRVDGDRRVLTEDFQALVWERYNLFAGNFSRNLGKDLKSQARRLAPERAVYRFAHYDTEAGALYVNDFGDGYYAVTPEAIEWRQNGTDVFFLSNDRAEPFEYVTPTDRPDLAAEIPGERPLWAGSGDAIMRLFGNRVNYDERAALAPADQRNQLYVHLHTLPFIDVLNARPIMAWVGEKGSGKTVLQRSIGRFIYGEAFTESVMPDSKDDFLAKVSNQALAFLDNYDDGVEWANDILAAVATGAGIDLREYYTTNDLHQEIPRCWLSLTSRDPPFRRDDVADRTLVFRVERVEDGFVGMGDYLRQVIAYRDLLWSVYLDNLQAIVRTYHERDTGAMSSDHRMADWAIFARIVGDALNVTDVDELLETMETERATFALENEPWAQVLGRWIEDNPDTAAEYRGAGDLADALEATATDHDLPLNVTHAAGLGSKLTTYREELAELYNLEIDDSDRSNEYRFATDDGHDPTGLGRYV